MPDIATVRALVAGHGELRPQFADSWGGDIPLPAVVATFYEQIGPWGAVFDTAAGPVGLTFSTIGNPITIPPLHKLWRLQ